MGKNNELLKCIMIYRFCALDLNLYLDNFPDDKNACEDYTRVSDALDNATEKYEKIYGPLSSFGSSYVENPEKWIETPWPWENENKED